MNAVNPVPSPALASAGGAEPSMEEILASIRRIIADDSAPSRLGPSPEHEIADPPPPPWAPHGAHGLHEPIAPPPAPSPEAPSADPADLSRHPLAPPDHSSQAPAEPEPLLSAAADASVTAAFNTLAASRFVDNSEQLMGLVREMIRPLVKAWVDEHLPGMVERIVAAEIERMARGGR